MSARFEILKGGWEDSWPHLRLEGDSAIGRREIDKEAKVSEDEKHDETEVEAHHGHRLVARNDEPADEPRRSEGDEGDDEVEAHSRRVARPGRQVG